MKILQVIHDFLPRHAAGSEIYTYKLGKALAERGHSVWFFFTEADLSRPQYTLRKLSFDGLPCFEAVNNHRYDSFVETYENPHMDELFNSVLDTVEPDVVHLQHLINHSINYIDIARQRGIPVVFTLHDYWLTCPRGGQRIRENLEICFRLNMSDCARCISRYSKSSYRLRDIAVRILKRLAPPEETDLIDMLHRADVKTPDERYVRKTGFAINGDKKRVLLAHPPSEITYRLKVPEGSKLDFSIAMPPHTFDKEGEGVRFRVLVEGEEVFSKYIDPKREAKDRVWHSHTVDLHKYHGRKVSLKLVTEPGPSKRINHCAAGWGGIRIFCERGLDPGGLGLLKRGYIRVNSLLNTFDLRRQIKDMDRRTNRIKEALCGVDLFIAPSRFLLEEFLRFGIEREKIIHSDYGFDTSGFSDTSDKDGERCGKTRFGYIGTLVPHKGVHVLVEAFNGMPQDKAELEIYGDLTWFPGYVARLKSLKKSPAISFMGGFDNRDISRILSRLDVLVVPSVWFENSPLTIHEAFMSGTPVITSNIGGMAELVEHKKSGLLFEVGDSKDLRRKMELIVNEPGLLKALKNGIPKVKTIEQDAADMEKRYESLLASTVRKRESSRVSEAS